MKTLRIGNEKGTTLVELMIVLFLMTLLTGIIAELTLTTVRSMMGSTAFGLAHSNAREVLKRMSNDLRSAGMPNSGGTPAILTNSGATSICVTTYGQNLDGLVPGTSDLADDVVCYSRVAQSGSDPSDVSKAGGYIPGGIRTAHGSGGGTPAGGLFQRITGPRTDIVNLQFEYCRPEGATAGSYNCSPIVNGGTISTNWECVFLIRIVMDVSRSPAATRTFPPPTTRLQASVMPRNIALRAYHQDDDDDGIIDCCDPVNSTNPGSRQGLDAAWCPPPQD